MGCCDVADRVRELAGSARTVVVSGGEPLIQQKAFRSLIRELVRTGFRIEVETNGTVVPEPWLLEEVSQINCSPKLSNSQNGEKANRIKPDALRAISASEKSTFKFVVSSQNDVGEILELVQDYNMKEVYLMPEGRSPEELQAHRDLVQRMCRDFKFTYAPRLHIERWGQKRGV